MAAALSLDELNDLTLTYPARFHQFRLLNAFLSKNVQTNPANLILLGQESTGKTTVLTAFLNKAGIPHSWIACDECLSVKVLLQRLVIKLQADIVTSHDNKPGLNVRVDNFSALIIQLSEIMAQAGHDWAGRVVVLDGIREEHGPALQVLIKLSEFVTDNRLTFVYVMQAEPVSASLPTSSLPRLAFPAYGKPDVHAIIKNMMTRDPGSIKNLLVTSSHANAGNFNRHDKDDDAQLRALWNSYAQVMVDTFFPLFGSDLRAMQKTARRSFARYCRPVLFHHANNTTAVDDDNRSVMPINTTHAGMVKLYKLNQPILASEDMVRNSLLPLTSSATITTTTTTTAAAAAATSNEYSNQGGGSDGDVAEVTKFLLCAAFLAAVVKPKHDIRMFSAIRESRKRTRFIRRGAKSSSLMPSSSSSSSVAAATNGSTGTGMFEYERMLAIFQCITPQKIDSVVDVHSQFATLVTLRLIVRAMTAGRNVAGGRADRLDPKARWKVNVPFDVIVQIARDIKLSLDAYVVE
ncbi:origin recognition complex subunit 5 C-terminus-domain-containing protein [Lipomyces japonicus]|uniref:origin recognition complex subunit 5 C-terminus-domain-containing protein n=1 Tax=Lipomyces japonicus TaxID=56871 RepID=UPI0034CDAC92